MKALVGKEEKFTYEEVDELYDKKKTEFLFNLHTLVREATDDEDEQVELLVDMSASLGQLLNMGELRGLLMDPDEYIANLPFNEGVRVEEV